MKHTIILILLPTLLLAQEFQFRQEFDTIPVEINGWQPVAPWTGGESETAPEFCDIDADGDYDCFIGNIGSLSSIGSRIIYYENIGSSTSPEFKYRTRFFGGVYIDSIYMGRTDPCFVDIDNDGDFDLFSSCGHGLVHFWENVGNTQNWQFELITDSLEYIQVSNPGSVAFTDIDGDDDFDLFIGDNWWGKIHYYQNVGSPENFDFVLVTEQFQDIDVGQRASPCFVDIDGDGDEDLFIGNSTGKIWFYRNDSDSLGFNFTLISNNYNGIDVVDAASPDFVDLEGDGDMDMVIGRDVMFTSSPVYGDVVFYENTGTAMVPEWTLLSEQYLTWDIGGSLNNHGTDIDGDFDYDLFIILAYCSPDYLTFYKNIGSNQEASFLQITDNYQDIHVNSGTPFFADIDNDLDPDLFIGEGVIPNPPYPGLHFYENIGNPQHAVFNLVSENLVPWNFHASIRPGLVDIDADGDKDLFLSDNSGVFYFWENIGSSTQPNFSGSPVLNWQGISTTGGRPFCFADIDQDSDFDLFYFNYYNTVWFYENIGTPQSANMQLITQTFLGEDIELIAPDGIDCVDIDADGDGDFIFSSYRGGMMFFRNITGDSLAMKYPITYEPLHNLDLSVGPNPANPVTVASFTLPAAGEVKLGIYDITGRLVKPLFSEMMLPGSHQFRWDAGHVASGVYIIKLQSAQIVQTEKVVVIR